MSFTERVYCVTVAFKMTEPADKLHHDNGPAHSTTLVQVFFGKASHHPSLSAPYSIHLAPCDFWLSPKANITVEMEEIYEFNGLTVHKLSQRRLTAD